MNPVAQYLRTSLRFQETYLERQRDIIANFAKEHGFKIVKTYRDPGRSGLVLRQRRGMQRLLNDVLQGRAGYQAVLVYDVSRWGRFQDPDEAAHYEFLCKSSGIPVYYCDEPQLNNQTVAAAIYKSMRRSQAGEFSRELSEKVFRAARRIATLGFRLGGTPGLGLRRMIVSPNGRPLHKLEAGDYKYSKSDRTILVPGPKQEVDLVREIFAMADFKRMCCQSIARDLNLRGVAYYTGSKWDYDGVHRLLTNPKYIGCNVWGRTSVKLRTSKRQVSPENWAVKYGAFKAIVKPEVFRRVQSFLRNRKVRPWTDQELLERLKALLARKGKLSQKLIDDTWGMPSSATYYAHFGPLRKVYPLIDYRPQEGTFNKIFRRDQNEILRARLFRQLCSLFKEEISIFHLPNRRRLILRLDNGLSVSVVLCRSLTKGNGENAWKIYPTRAERDYITLLCRLTPKNDAFLDFHLFPFIEKRSWYAFTKGDPWFRKGKRLNNLKDLCYEAKLISRLDDTSRNLHPVRPLATPGECQASSPLPPKSRLVLKSEHLTAEGSASCRPIGTIRRKTHANTAV